MKLTNGLRLDLAMLPTEEAIAYATEWVTMALQYALLKGSPTVEFRSRWEDPTPVLPLPEGTQPPESE